MNLAKLKAFSDKYNGWSNYEIDPWFKGENSIEFLLKGGVEFPNKPGIYGLHNSVNGFYYIGKAGNSLHSRLKGKLKADRNEQRIAVNYRKDGKLFHHYPYLPIYDSTTTKLFYLDTESTDEAAEAERILLGTCFNINGDRPLANRTGGKWALRHSGNEQYNDLFRRVKESFLAANS